MKLIVGLGNPGSDYAKHRHNIGFMALDGIVRRHGFSPWRQKFQGEICEGTIGAEKVYALKPLTYMNLSGNSVQAAADFYKIALPDIIVLHDELDLAPGKLRVKIGGGHAGHNGLRSIAGQMGPDFVRVRLGIGHPGAKELVTQWVLGNFAKADQDWLPALLDAVADAMPKLVTGDEVAFMTEVARLTQPERPQKAKAPEAAPVAAPKPAGPTETAKNAMAETLKKLLALKKPPGRRPGG
jgi:PTH1 family peptidyl-tRNA hydrolase